MGDPATFHAGRDLNTKSKPGSCGMLDRDSFMIHSVNICSMHGTSCVLAGFIPPITLELFVAPVTSPCWPFSCPQLECILSSSGRWDRQEKTPCWCFWTKIAESITGSSVHMHCFFLNWSLVALQCFPVYGRVIRTGFFKQTFHFRLEYNRLTMLW